jgi:DNA (cytosine-5)-methyltransferase 1
MLCGDIQDPDIFEKIDKSIKNNNVKFLIATPPCQGFSLVGKNKTMNQMQSDPRNYLFLDILKLIKSNDLDYILIENVPRSLQLSMPYKNKLSSIVDILEEELNEKYIIKSDIYNCAEYGIPQSRRRAIVRVYKKHLDWENPKKEKLITMRNAIGHLPSVESGEISEIKWHYGRKHSAEHVLCMRNTPEGKSAYENEIHRPLTKNGKTPKGFKTTYARMKWDEPCPTITIRNDAISSQRNVHPGVKIRKGIYSDSRVLSIKELFLLTGLGDDFDLPSHTPELLIRQVIGECVPPLLIKKICQKIK